MVRSELVAHLDGFDLGSGNDSATLVCDGTRDGTAVGLCPSDGAEQKDQADQTDH